MNQQRWILVVFFIATILLQAFSVPSAFAAEPFVIDDFSEALGATPDDFFNHDVVCITAWPSDDPDFPYCQNTDYDFEENTIAVGYRKVSLTAVQPLGNDELIAERTVSGEMTLSTFDRDTGVLGLEYGSSAQPLNLNLASKGSQFQIEVTFYDIVDSPAPIAISVTDGTGKSASASVDFSDVGTYTIPFSSFSDINFADIDQIALSFTDGDLFGFDLAFDNFLVTGEPLPLSGYLFQGFYSPVDNNLINTAKAGQSIPVKWRLTDAFGAPVSDPGSFIRLVTYSVSCGDFGGTPTDLVEEYASGSSGLQYNGDGYWQFNWKTPKTYAGKCRAMYLEFADGARSPIVNFLFKK